MAGISKRVWIILIATSAIAPLVHASEPPPVHYDIGLDIQNNEVEAITVRATLRAGDSGIVDFDPPWRDVTDVHAEAGTLDTSTSGRWRVTARPGVDVVLAWRSGKPEHFDAMPWNAWQRIVDQSHAVVSMGGAFLARPQGARGRRVTTSIAMPAQWHATTGLDADALTVATSSQASFLAAREAHTVIRPTETGATLRITATGPLVPDIEQTATVITGALADLDRGRSGEASPLKRLPQGAGRTFTLNIATFNGRGTWGSSLNGNDGLLYLSEDTPTSDWLLDVIRSFAAADHSDPNPGHAWFTQGVISYRVATAMRNEGRLSDVSFASHMDRTIVAYGGSPLRRASNARVIEDYDRIQEMHDLPSTRGELFAWLVDARMREATQGRKRLTDALTRMDEQSPDPGPALIAAVAAEGGGDITPLYQRYIADGELLQLPPDALGPCFSIGTVADIYGWQVQHVFAKPPSLCVGAAPPCRKAATPVCSVLPSRSSISDVAAAGIATRTAPQA
jgi:hypothetical protein